MTQIHGSGIRTRHSCKSGNSCLNSAPPYHLDNVQPRLLPSSAVIPLSTASHPVSTFLNTKTVKVEFVPGTNDLEDSASVMDVEIDPATEISLTFLSAPPNTAPPTKVPPSKASPTKEQSKTADTLPPFELRPNQEPIHQPLEDPHSDASGSMAEELVELGFEGFDRLVDKHYDTAHDHAMQYGRKIHRPKRWRKTAHGDTVQIVEEPHPEAERASSEPRIDSNGGSARRHGENDSSDSEDQGYASETRPKRRPRRYSGNESRSDPANHSQQRKPCPSESTRDYGHLYPPPPGQSMSYEQQQMQRMQPYSGQPMQPYTGQQLQTYSSQQLPPYSVPLAVPGVYEMGQPRSQSSKPHENRRRHDHDRDHRSSPPPRRRRSHRDNRHKKASSKDSSFGASLAGALAGGLIGHQAGKGDVFSTAAGAIVGAFSGSIAAEKHSQSKDRRRHEDY